MEKDAGKRRVIFLVKQTSLLRKNANGKVRSEVMCGGAHLQMKWTIIVREMIARERDAVTGKNEHRSNVVTWSMAKKERQKKR